MWTRRMRQHVCGWERAEHLGRYYVTSGGKRFTSSDISQLGNYRGNWDIQKRKIDQQLHQPSSSRFRGHAQWEQKKLFPPRTFDILIFYGILRWVKSANWNLGFPIWAVALSEWHLFCVCYKTKTCSQFVCIQSRVFGKSAWTFLIKLYSKIRNK